MKRLYIQPGYQAKLKEKYDNGSAWRRRPIIRITCSACGQTYYRVWTAHSKFYPDACKKAETIRKERKVKDAELVMQERISELVKTRDETVAARKSLENALAHFGIQDVWIERAALSGNLGDTLASQIEKLREIEASIWEMLYQFDEITDDRMIEWVERGARLDNIPYKCSW